MQFFVARVIETIKISVDEKHDKRIKEPVVKL